MTIRNRPKTRMDKAMTMSYDHDDRDRADELQADAGAEEGGKPQSGDQTPPHRTTHESPRGLGSPYIPSAHTKGTLASLKSVLCRQCKVEPSVWSRPDPKTMGCTIVAGCPCCGAHEKGEYFGPLAGAEWSMLLELLEKWRKRNSDTKETVPVKRSPESEKI